MNEPVSGHETAPHLTTLRVLLERARGARTPAEIATVLNAIADDTAAATGMDLVVVDLHRPAWNDFETVAVSGSPETRQALLGTSTQWSFWAPRLAPQYTRRGVQHAGPGGVPGGAVTGPWDSGEVLFSVLRRTNGDVLGMLRAGAPADGARPADSQIDTLALHGEIAALAVESALEASRGASARVALDGLAGVATRPPERRSANSSLEQLCCQVQESLGFGRVALMVAEGTGVLRPAASAGWDRQAAFFDHPWLTIGQLPLLLAPAYQRHGCALLERADVISLLDLRVPVPRCNTNGDGPYAWHDHWLLAGLTGPDGRPSGVLWADEPADRLLPDRERLRALSVFAGQATAMVALTGHGGGASGHDPLTGLPARATLADRLHHALRRNRRTSTGVSVLFLDLDRFSQINDRHGHDKGDEMLRLVASRIDHALRPSDTVARFGGDEFVVVCEDVGGAAEAMEVADRLRAVLAEKMPLADEQITVTASIGVAYPDHPGRGADELLQAADRAMYEAKADGRDTARLAVPGAGWP